MEIAKYEYTIESLDIILPLPVKQDFRFEGWFLNEGGNGESINIIKGYEAKDITLFAFWTDEKASEGLEYIRINKQWTPKPDGEYFVLVGIGSFQGQELSIGNVYMNKNIIGVKNGAFSENNTITKLILYYSDIVYDYSFKEMRALSEITFYKGFTALSEEMFYHCTALKKVEIPDHVKTLAYGVFDWC